MIEITQALPKAFAVKFSELKRWDPNSFHNIEWHWPPSLMAPIGSVLTPRKEKVDGSNSDFSDLMPVTIHFDGSIEPRKVSEDKEYTMDLFWARPGDIVASKIDLKNGALAIIPDDWDKVVVTSHFAVYEPNLEQINPKYFHLLIQAKFFKEHLWRNKVGAEGRKEVKLDFFESLEIPIPPLPIQQKIVRHWDKMQKKIEDIKACIEDAKETAFERFRESLGLSVGGNPKKPKFFAARWSTIGTGRWGVDLVWRDKTQMTVLAYPTKPLKSICKMGSGGTPSRKNKDYFGGNIPWVKTTEVRNRVIEDTEEKITAKGLASSSAKIYPAGSLVIAMYGQGATRGRTAKLGVDAATNQACLVLTDIDDSLDVDFLWYYLMESYEEMRQLASGNNQPNLSAELLGSFPVPIPSPVVQKDLKGIYESAQVEIENLKSRKKYLIQQNTEEIEKLVLGTLSVEEI